LTRNAFARDLTSNSKKIPHIQQLEINVDQLAKHFDLGESVQIKRLWCSSIHIKLSSLTNTTMSLTSIATAPISVHVGVVTIALEIGGEKNKDDDIDDDDDDDDDDEKDESKKKKKKKKPMKKTAGVFATKTAVRTFRNLIRLLQIRVDHITLQITSPMWKGAMMEIDLSNLAAISTPSGWDVKRAVRVSDGTPGLEATNEYEVHGPTTVLRHFKVIRISKISLRIVFFQDNSEDETLALLNDGALKICVTTEYSWSNLPNEDNEKIPSLESKQIMSRSWQKQVPTKFHLHVEASMMSRSWTLKPKLISIIQQTLRDSESWIRKHRKSIPLHVLVKNLTRFRLRGQPTVENARFLFFFFSLCFSLLNKIKIK